MCQKPQKNQQNRQKTFKLASTFHYLEKNIKKVVKGTSTAHYYFCQQKPFANE